MTKAEVRRGVLYALDASLTLMKNLIPQQLLPTMRHVGGLRGTVVPDDALAILVDCLSRSGPNDPILHTITMALQSWDHATEPWTSGTKQHSDARRALVLDLLGFSKSQSDAINGKVLLIPDADRPIVIAEKHQKWYEERRSRIKSFYWTDYSRQLQPPNGNWSSKSIGMLDLSVDDVIARLSDPTRTDIFAVKGLVMGYVQSGKTSHFSGLITKAADAGYRFIIVLAGTLDILRQQTQRRIDKEIVGKELLGTEEYGADDDWDAFVSHGGVPSQKGAFDWERLTNKDDDYKKLSKQLHSLAFTPTDKQKPFNDEANLRVAPAKIAVVKKVPRRLEKLCDDLETLEAWGRSLPRSRIDCVVTPLSRA
jgi:hypothetical protein